MDNSAIRKLLHDLSNSLNAAKINAYLLRRLHGDLLDRETIDGLDASLFDAEHLVADFRVRVHNEIFAGTPPTPTTPPVTPTAATTTPAAPR